MHSKNSLQLEAMTKCYLLFKSGLEVTVLLVRIHTVCLLVTKSVSYKFTNERPLECLSPTNKVPYFMIKLISGRPRIIAAPPEGLNEINTALV